MSFTPLDAIVIVVILVSAILAMVRGFVREVLSVASWVAAAVVAYIFYDDLLPVVQPYFDSETVALIVAAAIIFFVALIVFSYITMKISDWVIDSRAGALDRLLGFVFGGVRGVLLLVIAVEFFDWLVPQPPARVANSESKPILDRMGDQLIAALPQDIETMILERFRGGASDEEAAPQEAPAPAPDPALDEEGAGAAEERVDPRAQRDLDQLFENANPQQ